VLLLSDGFDVFCRGAILHAAPSEAGRAPPGRGDLRRCLKKEGDIVLDQFFPAHRAAEYRDVDCGVHPTLVVKDGGAYRPESVEKLFVHKGLTVLPHFLKHGSKPPAVGAYALKGLAIFR
jgi:hypothetical protein